MDDTENVVPGYSPPSFSSDGFTSNEDASSNSDEGNQIVDAEFTDSPQTNRRQRKKRTPSTRRVEELLYERGNLEQQNNFLVQQALERDALIAEQNQRIQQYEESLARGDAQNDQYFEDSLNTQENRVLESLKRAKEDGDIDEEIKLTDELADIKAKKNTHQYAQFQKQAQQQQRLREWQEEPYVPIETYIPQSMPRQEPVNEDFQDWLEDNDWYRNNPRLKEEADQFGQELADRLSFNNQSQMIGTRQYLDAVSEIMSSRYGLSSDKDDFDNNDNSYSQPEETTYKSEYPAMTSNNYANLQNSVAPVTRRTPSMANQYVQNRNTQGPLRALSKEEFAIARNLQVKKGEGESDLIRRYAERKNYPKSPLPGGSPHRLTII